MREQTWSAIQQDDGDWGVVSNGERFATLHYGYFHEPFTSNAEIFRRAHLFAAAPDLYEGLKTALHALDGLTDKGDAMTRGLAALSKARGEK